MAPERPANEPTRLSELWSLHLLDSEPEGLYQDLADLAALVTGTPIALISLVDANRQWFKARVGMEACQTGREVSFCGHAILQPDVMVIPNALKDPRFADNPLVTTDPKLRFYAGTPLTMPSGHVMGTLCVMDLVPRELSERQLDALRALGRQTVALMHLRRHAIRMAELVREMTSQGSPFRPAA